VRKIAGFLTILLLLFVFASCGRPPSGARNVVLYENDGSAEDIVLENEFLRLRFLPRTTEIILTDKSNGAQWRSNPLDYANDPQADVVTKDFMGSLFTLDYADAAGVGMTLYSGANSVALDVYGYELIDNTLEVRYSIGDIDRSYIIPPAAPEQRVLTFLGKMEEDDRFKVEASYRLYDINNLRSSDDKSKLLAAYPDLSRTKVFVLRDNTPEYMKEMMEEFFAQAGYTYDDYMEDVNRYTTSGGANKPAFNVTLRYSLDERSLILNVPFDKIAYRLAFPVTQIRLLPYFGAGGKDDKGYILVPDGSGALIYFNNGRQNQIAYNNNIYGWDEAMPRNAVINDNKAPYPVFGIQKNGNALLCVIEEGSSYGGIRADVSGRNSSWNCVYPEFNMVHGAIIDISGRSDRAVYLYERGGLPAGENITLRYTLCADDGYAGMAKEYRSWLVKKYPSLGKSKEEGVPIAIEIVGAVNKTQHRLGIPFDLPLKLTSYKESAGMIDDFAKWGWKNVRIKLNGWFNRSVDHSVPNKIKLISDLGGKKDFKNLLRTAEKNGYEVYPDVDFMYMRDVKLFGGFSLYRDAARYVNRKRIEKYPYSFVWFGERIRWGKLNYLARPVYTMSLIDTFTRKADALGIRNIAFRNMGAKLAGDYHEKRLVSREASMKMRQDKLAELTGNGRSILLNTGYAYAVPWADFITDITIDDQSFGITDVSVPFYQMALHGLAPYTGPAINLAEDYTKNLLKTVESGAGLYFSFMSEETSVLQETKFRQFYANEYNKWSPDANALYQKFSADFAGLYDKAITGHTILPGDLRITEYEDGTRVIVNGGEAAAAYGEVVINARSYAVVRRDN
jgi:hypothetical protein